MIGLPVSDCQYSEQHKNPGEPICTTLMLNQGCPVGDDRRITCELYQPINREVIIVGRPDKPLHRFKSGSTVVQYGMRIAKHDDIFGNTVEDLWIYNFIGIRALWLQQLTWAELNKVARAVAEMEYFPPEFLAIIDAQVQLKGDF